MNINGDKNKVAIKHLVTFPWRMYLLIGIVGLTLTGIVVYSLLTVIRINTIYTPLIDASMEIMLEVTTAHLWFEEILSGDSNEDIEIVWEHMDQADWYARAMLEGGENPEGTFIPLDNAEMRQMIREIQEKLAEFRDITRQRLAAKETSGAGSGIDQHYDDLYKAIINQVDEVETTFQQVIVQDLRNFRITQKILFVTCILVCMFFGISFYHFEHRRKKDFLALNEMIIKMEIEIKGRKKIEKARRESEVKYRELANLLPQTVFELDIEGNIIFTNRYGFESTGYSEEDMEKGVNALQLYIPEERERVKKNIGKVLRGEEFEDHEYTILRKDGSTFPVLIYSNAIIHDNKPVGVRGIVLDISERKKAEQEKEKLLHDLGERVKELNCLYGLCKIVEQPGISLEEIFENMIYLIPPGWQYPDITCARVIFENKKFKTDNFKKTRWKQSADIKVNGKKAGFIEVYYLEERPELDEGPFLKEERNLINALAERLSDIAKGEKTKRERNNLTSRLQETTHELNTIIESVGDAILTIDVNYNIVVANKAFSEMLGLPVDEIVGKQCSEVLRCMDEKENILCERECGLKQTIEKGATAVGRAVIQNSEGIPITIESINSPLKSADGRIVGAVRAIRDISKEAEIDRMKTEFISTVSHELRTPLTPIQGYIDLILDGDTGEINDLQREFLDLVSQNTERLSMLINDLLDIEKIESGKVSLDMKKVSFSDLVLNAVKTMAPQAKKKELDLITDIQDGVEGYADPDRITQILSNLVSNAIKFTPEGSITIKLHTYRGKAEISVRDTGVGISASDRKKLFAKFFRAEDAYTRKAGGTGLGLSIVKELVEMHKGEIIVKSTLQKGSEFKVILPLKLKKTKKTNN